MKVHPRNTLVISACLSFLLFQSSKLKNKTLTTIPRIQVAILLDVSSSMNGLIEQAKNQLWNMVKVLEKVTCNGDPPSIEIALYEYGRPANNPNDGFVKVISPFSKDLDKLFGELIALTTNGGDEYCGHVMYNALTQLAWDSSSASYKVIFIAGNESFLQGDISITKACEEAKKKGVIVNTIYCGDRSAGLNESWDLGAECGNGSFSNINQEAKPLSIPTPFDDSIIRLKMVLNNTYVYYGYGGEQNYDRLRWDYQVFGGDLNDPSKITQYVIVKSDSRFNENSDWDLVQAFEKKPSIIDTVEMKYLPDSLKSKNRQQLKQVIEQKVAERKRVQATIKELALKQEQYITTEKEKQKLNNPSTLESEIEKIIREQVKQVNMKIE